MKTLLVSLLILLGTTTFAYAGHCSSVTDELNELMGNYPGSKAVADYEGMDALVYIGFVNASSGVKGPPGTLVGDEVLIVMNPSYPEALVIVFHEGCFAGAKSVPRSIHDNWNEMITGPGT
jgi:hypothetical protein